MRDMILFEMTSNVSFDLKRFPLLQGDYSERLCKLSKPVARHVRREGESA